MSVTQTNPAIPRVRGYAMIIVLLVLTLMGIAVGSMAAVLDATIAEGRRTNSTIRTDFACGSALDLAGRTIKARLAVNAAADPDDLVSELCGLGTCDTVDSLRLPRFLAPPGMVVDRFEIYFESATATTREVSKGPFAPRIAVDQTLVVTLIVRDTQTGRDCEATDRYALPSFPLTSFALFGTARRTTWAPPLSVRRVNDGLPSAAHLNGNPAGSQISAADFVLPGPQFLGDRDPVDLVTSTRGSTAVLSAAVGTPATTAHQANLERNFHWLVEPPAATDSTALGKARLSEQADIVIIDGVWYNNRSKVLPWPGKAIWSDRPGTAVGHVSPANAIVDSTDKVGMGDLGFVAGAFPRRYSWYDRDRDGSADPLNDTIRAQTGGVLSYGPLAVVPLAATCNTDSDCPAPAECLKPTNALGTCQRIEPGFWDSVGCPGPLPPDFTFKSVTACGGNVNAIVDGTRSGFSDEAGAFNVLPINIDVGALAAALTDSGPNELGAVVGPGFNGILYVTSRFSSALPAPTQQAPSNGPDSACNNGGAPGSCPGAASNSIHRPHSINRVPLGLCGSTANLSSAFTSMTCADASRPNAVRVFNAGVVAPGVFRRGLTIATDLPLYVYGDVNRVAAATPQVKVAFVADRITFLSRGWRDADHPWNDAAIAGVTGRMIVEGSVISGLPERAGPLHDIADVFRTPQVWDDNNFVLRGSIIAGWNSVHDTRTVAADRVNRGLRWLPDYHLENPSFQPPGMPLLPTPPSGVWRQH